MVSLHYLKLQKKQNFQHILVIADHMWNTFLLSGTTTQSIAHDIEMAQHNVVRYISRLKGRDSITSAFESLNLKNLAARRGKTRHSLLLKLLTNEENHNSLIHAYEDLNDTRPTNIPNTRTAAIGDPQPIYAKTSAYQCHNSFLPTTVRKLKANLNRV